MGISGKVLPTSRHDGSTSNALNSVSKLFTDCIGHYHCPNCDSSQPFYVEAGKTTGEMHGTRPVSFATRWVAQCGRCHEVFDPNLIRVYGHAGTAQYAKREHTRNEGAFYQDNEHTQFVNSALQSTEIGKTIYRALILVALADGQIDEQEVATLNRMSEPLLGWRISRDDLIKEVQALIEGKATFAHFLASYVARIYGLPLYSVNLSKGAISWRCRAANSSPTKRICSARCLRNVASQNNFTSTQFKRPS